MRDTAGVGIPAAVVSVARVATPDRAVGAVETDDAGRFLIDGLAPGEWRVVAGRIGYREANVELALRAGERRVIALVLAEFAVALDSVTVEADRARERFEHDAGVTARVLTGEQLASLPGLAEPDVLRAIEVLPGVVTTSDFSSAFNVRGGSADQNLILLDGIPIFNPFHLGGLFSVFNSDMVARAELLAGGFPAEHGGRVSSVLTVESDPGSGGFDVDAGVSLLATRVALGDEVPDIVRDRLGVADGRWRIAGRRSYFDQLLRPIFDFPYHLTDLQGFLELTGAEGDRVTVSGYTGTDLLDLRELENFPLQIRWDWGNDLIGARWQHALASDLRLDARASYTHFGTSLRFPDFGDTDFHSDIAQTNARVDVRLDRPSGLGGAVGASLDRIGYDNHAASGGTVFRAESSDGWLPAAYGQAILRTPRWLLEGGLRAELWKVADERDFGHVAPRVAAKRFLGNDAAVKLALGRYAQYVHSVRNEELPFGLDIWVTAGDRAPAIVSDQVQAGIESFFADDAWFASLEAYARRFDGLIAFNVADDPNLPADDFLRGEGNSYGVDMLVRRDRGAGPHGWLAVSWLRASRTLPAPGFVVEGDPMEPLTYPPIWDRRLDVDVVLNQDLAHDWELGVRFNFGSGLPYTRALGSFAYLDWQVATGGLKPPPPPEEAGENPFRGVFLGGRNAERYPAYHRLDVSVRRSFEQSWGSMTAYAQVLNVYNRRNVLFYFYQMDRDPPVRTGLSMLPVLPTLGVEVSF